MMKREDIVLNIDPLQQAQVLDLAEDNLDVEIQGRVPYRP
jgi:hypothetical protein